ncbi:hypothetical protein HY024_00375 [Candidatus Curtissbacteria bacterium]|nr:hypothetical protein [Candidatus Curtissbacteria bacterium]
MRKLIFQIQRLLAWKHFYVLIAVVGLVGGAVIFLPKILGGKVLSMTIYAVPTVVPTPIPTPPPIPTPTPTPTPSPTPTPVYTGYCLNVPVIFYHHIQPLAEAKTQGHESLTVDNGVFDTQMAYLKSKGYTTISAQQLANALFSKQGVPGHSIVVSVDDGYSDFFSYGYPIAQKFSFTLTVVPITWLLMWLGKTDMGQLTRQCQVRYSVTHF